MLITTPPSLSKMQPTNSLIQQCRFWGMKVLITFYLSIYATSTSFNYMSIVWAQQSRKNNTSFCNRHIYVFSYISWKGLEVGSSILQDLHCCNVVLDQAWSGSRKIQLQLLPDIQTLVPMTIFCQNERQPLFFPPVTPPVCRKIIKFKFSPFSGGKGYQVSDRNQWLNFIQNSLRAISCTRLNL